MLPPVDTARPPTPADRAYGAAARCVFGGVWLAARAWGARADELRARIGALPEAHQPLVWFHGASAGEMAAAARLTATLRQHGCRFTAAYTATNRAGVEFISRTQGPDIVAAFVPWDHPRWVARAFDQWRPLALVLVETELWPQLILEACRRRIPVFCVSARIYPRDVARYRLIRRIVVPMLTRLTRIVVQSDIERERFLALGAPPERCLVGGNLKYIAAASANETTLRDELEIHGSEPVLVFGSVHADEVDFVCSALDRLPANTVRVIIAPRHGSAVAAIVNASRRRHRNVHQITTGRPPRGWQVLVLDRMGDLTRAYAIASVGVVGGGFGEHGGHNPLEPVMAGTPVIFGQHFGHFAQEAQALAMQTPQAQVSSAAQLAERLAGWLANASQRQGALDLQRQALPDGAAIAQRYVDALMPWLEGIAA